MYNPQPKNLLPWVEYSHCYCNYNWETCLNVCFEKDLYQESGTTSAKCTAVIFNGSKGINYTCACPSCDRLKWPFREKADHSVKSVCQRTSALESFNIVECKNTHLELIECIDALKHIGHSLNPIKRQQIHAQNKYCSPQQIKREIFCLLLPFKPAGDSWFVFKRYILAPEHHCIYKIWYKIKPRSKAITKKKGSHELGPPLQIERLLMIGVKRLEVCRALNAPEHKNKFQQLNNHRAARSRLFKWDNQRKQG